MTQRVSLAAMLALGIALVALEAAGFGGVTTRNRHGAPPEATPAARAGPAEAAGARGLAPPKRSPGAWLYALNCMGCHTPARAYVEQAPKLVGQFAQTETGRMFFIRLPEPGDAALTADADARLRDEVLAWKRSCHVLQQRAPLVRFAESPGPAGKRAGRIDATRKRPAGARGPARSAAPAHGTPAGAATAQSAQSAQSARVELGRQLFFETRLSGDGSRSCASCHAPEHAFADGRPLSDGYNGGAYFRNAPSLLDVGHRGRLMWDGRLDGKDLATAVREMVTDAAFMNADGRLVQERLQALPRLRALWRQAYGEGSEPYGPRMFEAIAAYVRTLQTPPTRYDRFAAGERDALSALERRGLELFEGKARCAACHPPPRFTDGGAHALGAPHSARLAEDPLRSIALLRHHATLGVPNYMAERADSGRYAVTREPRDRGRFLTPSLRGVAHTAPYLHDGSLATLDEVVAFHAAGGGGGAALAPVALDPAERRALVAFLLALSPSLPAVAVPPADDYAPLPAPVATRLAGERARPGASPTMAADPQPPVPPADWPPLAPLPRVPVPADNPMSPAKVELGRLLFFDPRLSGDASTSCAACHHPALGWGEREAISRGYPGTRHWRNSQTVLNAAYANRLFWDGAAGSLEAQAKSAAEGAIAGNGDPSTMEMRLRLVPEYVERFRQVFGTQWPRLHNAWQAIAAFERTLVSDPLRVPFDRWLRGDATAMSEAALRGYRLFEGKARCIACHGGPFASDQRFHSLGVPRPRAFDALPLVQATVRWQAVQRGVPHALQRERLDDLGLYYATGDPADAGKFRTPTLRELRHTAPYMHNGAFATLREVVDFFDRGGGDVPGKSPLLVPLGLSDAEKEDLVAFLEALSMDDPPRVEAPAIPPYAPLPPLPATRTPDARSPRLAGR